MSRRSDAVLLVPPFLKVVSGPLLGPAMLAGAAEAAGFSVRVFDVNAAYIASQLRPDDLVAGPYIGDHDKPEAALTRISSDIWRGSGSWSPDAALRAEGDHQQVLAMATAIANGPTGEWAGELIQESHPPRVVGVSLMHVGQVVWGLALAMLARSLWPDSVIVAGGTHVTALADEIASDPRYGMVFDRFVAGYAERTFVNLLLAAPGDYDNVAGVFSAGAGRWSRAVADDRLPPLFAAVHPVRWPRPTLPAQSTRGCSYGMCTFCTYPAIEGAGSTAPLSLIAGVVGEAQARGAAVSFKDSLIVPTRLRELAQLISGRVEWSAVTKLSGSLTRADYRLLSDAGCRTLEFGLETLAPEGQRIFRKPQPLQLLRETLERLSDTNISVIINYITGIPGVSGDQDSHWVAILAETLSDVAPRVRARVEHHRFELERLAPLARTSQLLKGATSHPWSSTIDYHIASISLNHPIGPDEAATV